MAKSWELDGEREREGGRETLRILKGERKGTGRISLASVDCSGSNINLWLFILHIIEELNDGVY